MLEGIAWTILDHSLLFGNVRCDVTDFRFFSATRMHDARVGTGTIHDDTYHVEFPRVRYCFYL